MKGKLAIMCVYVEKGVVFSGGTERNTCGDLSLHINISGRDLLRVYFFTCNCTTLFKINLRSAGSAILIDKNEFSHK